MGDFDTSLGGGRRDFPSTAWSQLLFRPGDSTGRRAAERLVKLYWKPIYAFTRSQWAKSNEDAKDLTQGFFVWMIESDFLSKADRNRGRFRSFVKVALRHYLSNEVRDTKRIKRGGGQELLSLDAEPVEELPLSSAAAAAGRSPEEILDDAWRNELMLRAASMLEGTLRGEGKGTYFAVFRDYFLKGQPAADYRTLAAAYKISEVDVSNYLMHAKNRFRAILTDLVAETVENEEELRDELKALFGEGG